MMGKSSCQIVCRWDDLDEVEARGFDIETADGSRSGFIVRRDKLLVAYRNVCPHAGNRLDWKPHAFLTRSREMIMCAVHGAVFEIGSGECVEGPCPGRSLTPLRVECIDGQVVVYPD
jgi:nitrite reductase/ring-hydroxylating ferredoxin subunit